MPNQAMRMKASSRITLCSLVAVATLLTACKLLQIGKPTPAGAWAEIPYWDLVVEDLDPVALNNPGIPGCSLVDLRPINWKEVDSGLVDIRSPMDYAIRTESLYQEGYLDYLQTRVEHPEIYQSVPEMTYEAFLATCNVFPEVDFAKYSLLGFQVAGTGCEVSFEKKVYRDDSRKKFIYALAVIEQGSCESETRARNLILVPMIPTDFSVEFSIMR